MEDRVEQNGLTQTTVEGLIRLAESIEKLVTEQAIDSRLGGKLLKRLEKEAKLVEQQSLKMTQKRALRSAMEKLDEALLQSDANLLVLTNAKLRSTDETLHRNAKAKS